MNWKRVERSGWVRKGNGSGVSVSIQIGKNTPNKGTLRLGIFPDVLKECRWVIGDKFEMQYDPGARAILVSRTPDGYCTLCPNSGKIAKYVGENKVSSCLQFTTDDELCKFVPRRAISAPWKITPEGLVITIPADAVEQ